MIEVEIQSTGLAGTNYDLLAISGQADLQGTMTLLALAYTVTNNDAFQPITYASRTVNTFGTITPIGGETPTPTYNPTTFDLVLTLSGVTTNFTNGNANLVWNDPGNWDNGIPTIIDDAVIGVFDVTIGAAANAGTLSLASGGSITVSTGALTISSASTLNGDLTINGAAASVCCRWNPGYCGAVEFATGWSVLGG